MPQVGQLRKKTLSYAMKTSLSIVWWSYIPNVHDHGLVL